MDYAKEPHGVFFLIDNKSFYASVECVQRGLDPLSTPLVVLSEQENTNGGLILAASPMAKKLYGISNVSRQRDLPKNKNLLIVPPRMNLYIEKNLEINQIFRRYAHECVPYSIDETILDLTFSWHLFGSSPSIVAKRIQADVHRQLGLYTTVGIGENPLQAKLALDILAKHSANLRGKLSYADFADKIWPITELSQVWSIGHRTEDHLHRIGIRSIGDLAHTAPPILKKEMGVIGLQLLALAWGIDRTDLGRPVKVKNDSLGNSQVLPRDYRQKEEIEVVIQEIGEQVAARLRKRGKQTACVSLSIGFSYTAAEETGRRGFAHQLKIDPTNDNRKLNSYLLRLFRENWQGESIRNIAVGFGQLITTQNLQLNLFYSVQKQEKHLTLEKTLDDIRNEFGTTALFLAHSLKKGGTMLQRAGLVGGHNGGNSFS
ncbi:excinuclease ABC subunit A [Ligilactobacillus salitolerans]|uniref:Excinuclease ABC subunit A n=1 Tax=Ligilactobacillus salitolerans TaxID=1808352 RepID=A0A401IWG4_9LACO|nr:Y-family DNA polymerase [Ligilactobacillus salitolerans]GBG95849.1 excinuclease ABC subunit A [Ligilactobacillus salitolerans]